MWSKAWENDWCGNQSRWSFFISLTGSVYFKIVDKHLEKVVGMNFKSSGHNFTSLKVVFIVNIADKHLKKWIENRTTHNLSGLHLR